MSTNFADDLPTLLTGGCQCGRIRYEINGAPLLAATCHCRDCQYESGGAPAHGLVVAVAALRIVQGEPATHARPSGVSGGRAMRRFCPDCGTPLFAHTEGTHYLAIKAGSLDEPERFRPDMAIWTASAPSWHRLDPDLPSFPQNPPA